MLQSQFGNRVKEIRLGQSISQLELANRTGIERAQISKIEQGKINVTLETIEKISKALNVQLNDFLTFDNPYNVRPFVKWAGGKTQLLNKIKELLPINYNRYYEPFVGGGALFLYLAPKEAFINDINKELISAYLCFQNDYLYDSLVRELERCENEHSQEFYYRVREIDRLPNFSTLPISIHAARLIYLNKACFNGLYRVNAKGYFNVPSGNKEKVKTFDRDNFIALKKYFSSAKIHISSTDFEEVVGSAQKGDFVYFDPPYDVYPNKNGFVDYSKEGFKKEEQERLAKTFKNLNEKGVYVMLSNHNTEFINELYKDFNIHVVKAKRMINSKADGRGDVEEVLITNY